MHTVCTPEEAVLCGIKYHITVHEDAVQFSSMHNCGPCYNRLQFVRKSGCWYVTICSFKDDAAMVAHIVAAYDLVCRWFGSNHECLRGENCL